MWIAQSRQVCADTAERRANLRKAAPTVASAFYLVLLLMLLLPPAPVAAQEGNRAGLVIIHGDGSIATQCVAFPEESISGAELLARSGFDLSVEASSMGATICRIDGEGCAFPGEACFCQCQGSPCVYWSYWRLVEGEWRYSNLGAGNTVIRAGDVDGWRWGAGANDQAEAPPAVAFADICRETSQAIDAQPALTPAPAEDQPIKQSASLPVSTPALTTHNADASGSLPPSLTPLAAMGMVIGALVILPAAALVWIRLRAAGKERRR